jgi:hypothetical protein
MDAFDYSDAKKASPVRNTAELVWNILTLFILLAAFIVGAIALSIFVNPYASINPFPPPTRIVLPTSAIPTPTETPVIQLPPTWTPEPTNEPTATFTLRPSSTPIPSNTPFGQSTETPTSEISPTPGDYSFVLQQGSPQSIPNIAHPDDGCNWLGVAGQANSLNGSPVIGLFIQLGGTLQGQVFETRLSMTGTATEYGRGGFEFVISDKPVVSNQTLWVQLLDQANLPLSDKVYFKTYEDCEKNLILINFAQVK